MTTSRRLRSAQIAAARLAGRGVRITLEFLRNAFLGVLGAAGVTFGAAGIVQRVFGRGLGWPAGLVVAGVFLMLIARQLNAPPPAPRRDEE